jgi:hypothetical protein
MQQKDDAAESSPLPLVSGRGLLQLQPEHIYVQIPQVILHSIDKSIRALVENPDQYLPEHAVAFTFASHDGQTITGINSAVLWFEGHYEENFISAVTAAIALERQLGLYNWGEQLVNTQRGLVGEDAPLIGISALMGLRNENIRVGEREGTLALTYQGDGHIASTLLDRIGDQAKGTYETSGLDKAEEVLLPSGVQVDVRGDLAMLYSTLTASDEEHRLFS